METIYTDNFKVKIPLIESMADVRNITRKKKEKKRITKEISELSDFPTTIYITFRKFTLKYNSPQISLTAAEVFSLIVGLKYMSKNRGVVEIKPTLTYFKRMLNVLNKKFVISDDKYSQPVLF